MPDIEIFNLAVYWAQMRALYRRRAEEGGTANLTRRQCQLRARKAEGHIVDLAIKAETRARRELAARAAA